MAIQFIEEGPFKVIAMLCGAQLSLDAVVVIIARVQREDETQLLAQRIPFVRCNVFPQKCST